VDRAVEWSQEAPEDGSGPVAQNRAHPAGEDGGHEAAVQAETAVADGVNTSVDAMKTANPQSPRDSALVQPCGVKLGN
jgi:hypothetical protein